MVDQMAADGYLDSTLDMGLNSETKKLISEKLEKSGSDLSDNKPQGPTRGDGRRKP